MKKEDKTGLGVGISYSAENYADNVVLGAKRGHGFAAEKANHLYDKFSGQKAKIVGSDNAKNGADRIVNGTKIQTKYCSSGSKCIFECFENNVFRYVNVDGSPMKIEVPSDKYESAISAMEERIRKGQISGVHNPDAAKDIVKKGAFTYEQVRNIAQFGTIESLTYDVVNGIKLTGTAMGISSVITFAVAIWNGYDSEKALKKSCCVGLKVCGIAWISSVIAAQVGRTTVEQGLRGTTDWVVNIIGSRAASWIANGLRSGGHGIYGAAALNNVSKLLRGNIVTGVITTLVLSSVDFVRLFNGKASGIQVFKNVTTTASALAGGTGGWLAGAAGGAALGTAFFPAIGTAVGGFIGGLCGAFVGSTTASKMTSTVLDQFIKDDAKQMLSIIEKNFGELAFDYLLSKKEAKLAIDTFMNRDIPNYLRDMYASSNRKKYARGTLRAIIKSIVKTRKTIKLPSDKALIKKVGNVINELIDIEKTKKRPLTGGVAGTRMKLSTTGSRRERS